MSKYLKYEDSSLILSGDLTFSNVMDIWHESLELLDQYEKWHFNLSQVSSSSSAGLALLFEWVKLARKKNKEINFSDIPPQLLSIAQVCHIDNLLC